ncbi:hypothetical protein [Pseudoalteromonas phenolica]|uniref:hypothetical protein n=1 Tax=Pseudoalteromonas phenolica TaxID=161398 RepID=UPI00384B6ADB
MKSFAIQLISALLILGALLLSIPPVPSVDVGHGYDSFPSPSLFIGLLLLVISACITIKYLNFPKAYWLLMLIIYVLFSFAIHARVWW